MTIDHTPVDSIPKVVAALRSSFRTHRTQSLEFRKEQLRALQRMVSENVGELQGAIKSDLNRPKDFEVPSVIKTCEGFIQDLDTLTQNRKASGEKESDDCFVRLSPLGTVLIIGTWNFPIGLVLEPLAGALAAGNNCVVKPSEISEASAKILTRLLTKYMDPQVVSVVNGGVDETTALLNQRFDHIFYTGGTDIGKIIMTAAAKNLTPVTLELGGKCPTIITEHTDIAKAAQRIAAWKIMNCGQVCITVDYILCPRALQQKLIENVIGCWKHMFGENIRAAENYPRIVSKRQHERLQGLLKAVEKENKIVHGGKHDVNDLFIEPTIVTDVDVGDTIMQGEIFGPILPIITCESLDNAIDIVNQHEHSLGLNLFSDKQEDIDQVLRETRSGAVTVNDVSAQYGNHSLPFGGVGNSGLGNYHGKYSIDTFSHHRAVSVRSQAHL